MICAGRNSVESPILSYIFLARASYFSTNCQLSNINYDNLLTRLKPPLNEGNFENRRLS